MRLISKLCLLSVCGISPLLGPLGRAAAPADTGVAVLEEIVVTAQKRSEDLQKASIAVDVVKAEEFAQQGIKNAIDLQDIVPALRFIAADQMTVNIRGLGTINDNPGVDSAVAYSEDGVYLTHPSALTPVLHDLQRVEVLLGPQGTLYGRNSNGGVVNFISNDPSFDKVSGYVKVGGGNYSAFNSDAAINLPINSQWALRISEGSERHNAYVDDGSNNLDAWAARAKLLYRPNDDLSIKLTVDGGKHNSIGNAYGAACPPGNVDPFCAKVPWKPWSGFPPLSTAAVNNYSNYGASLNIDANLGWATLTSLTAYRGYDLNATTSPAMYTGAVDFTYTHPDHSRAETQEFRLNSLSSSPVKWVAGLFYAHETQPSSVLFDYINTILQNPAIVGPHTAPPNFFQKFSIVSSDYKSVAVFGDVTVPVTDSFRLRGGLRFTHDDKTSTGTSEQGVGGVDFGPVGVNQAALRTDKVTWKAGADFDITPQNLLYATVSTGFKSGGVNNLPASIGLTTYAPETITAYEIGSKNRFADNRIQVNLAAFRYDYKNYQTFEFYQPSGGPFVGATLFPTLNSQKATFQGGELQTEFALTAADRLRFDVNILKNTFDTFVISLPFAPVQNLSGTDVPLSPKTAYTLAYEHKFNLGAAGSLAVGADAHYSADYLATGNQGAFAGNAPYTQPSYTKTNAHVSWNSGDSGWEVSAFIRNISNKASINTVAGGYPVIPNFFVINAMIDPPRTFGATVKKEF